MIVEERSRVVAVDFPRQMPQSYLTLFVTHGEHDPHGVPPDLARRPRPGGHPQRDRRLRRPAVHPLPPAQTLRVGMRTDASVGYMEVSSTPGGFVGYVPIQEWYGDWHSRIGTRRRAGRSGAHPRVRAPRRVRARLAPTTCEQIAAHNGIELR